MSLASVVAMRVCLVVVVALLSLGRPSGAGKPPPAGATPQRVSSRGLANSLRDLTRAERAKVVEEERLKRANRNRKANAARAQENAAKRAPARRAFELPRMPEYLARVERASPAVKRLAEAIAVITDAPWAAEYRKQGYAPWFPVLDLGKYRWLVVTETRRLLVVSFKSGQHKLRLPRAKDFAPTFARDRQAVRKALRDAIQGLLKQGLKAQAGAIRWAAFDPTAISAPATVATTVPSSASEPARPTGGREAIDGLFRLKERPTLEQLSGALKAAYGEIPKQNPFGARGRLRARAEDIADMIAQLELAYPGGTWLPLGRDAVLVADVLDGFYRAIGQPGRVRRLDASGTSFPHYRSADDQTQRVDRPILAGFLKSNGLDLDRVGQDPPFIMIDVTGYGPTSQSTQLVRAVYRTWAAAGRDPKELFDKVNFVGIPQLGARYEIARAGPDIDGVKAALRAATTSDGPREILYLRGAKELTYSRAWHGMFQQFMPGPGGSVRTEPGYPAGVDDRLEVLSQLYEVAALTSSPEFRGLVEKAAERYGYRFPLQRTFALSRLAPKVGVAAALPPAEAPAVSPTSTFVGAIRRELSHEATPARAAEFLEDLAGMWGRRTVTDAQLQEAVREIGRYVKLEDPLLRAMLVDLRLSHPGFASAAGLPP